MRVPGSNPGGTIFIINKQQREKEQEEQHQEEQEEPVLNTFCECHYSIYTYTFITFIIMLDEQCDR